MKLSHLTLPILLLLSLDAFSQTAIPGRVEAEDYSAYVDKTPNNEGGAYRNDDVDINYEEHLSGGHSVGWTQPGESLSYPVSIQETGIYDITLKVAQDSMIGLVALSLDDQVIGNRTLSFLPTESNQGWQDVTLSAELPQGESTLKLDFLRSGVNVDYIDFSLASSDQPEYPEAPSCSLPYFEDTTGRCVRPHRKANFYCEAPSTPFEFKLTASQYTIMGCENPRSSQIPGDSVLIESCPSPYFINDADQCVLADVDETIQCLYPLRIGTKTVYSSAGVRFEPICDY